MSMISLRCACGNILRVREAHMDKDGTVLTLITCTCTKCAVRQYERGVAEAQTNRGE